MEAAKEEQFHMFAWLLVEIKLSLVTRYISETIAVVINAVPALFLFTHVGLTNVYQCYFVF